MKGDYGLRRLFYTSLAVLFVASALGCSHKNQDKVVIGLAMDTLKEERWQRDRDLFVAHAEKLGAKVMVQTANGDDAIQLSQVENLLTQGIDALVVVPHNAEAAAAIVEKAHEAGVKVISYDRLIRNADVDMYLSFDPVGVGRLQAKSITKLVPKGRYALIEGADTDNNAYLLKQGQMEVLKPFLDRGDIKIVFDQWTKEWKPEEALKNMENALTANKNRIDAVIAANDGTAGGVIQALAAQGLDGKIPVTGQDGELAACQRVVEGKQAMTIYKPLSQLADKAAETAIAFAKNEEVKSTHQVPNGKAQIPAILLEPLAVDRSNMNATVIKDGYHKLNEVYGNLPKAQWPK